jgi:hypothetical protein
MPSEGKTPAPEFLPPSLDGLPATNPLACYRVFTVARGLARLNQLAAEGWELIRTEFCEEILRAGTGPSQQRAQIVYQPYSLVGKRDTLMATDRQAMEEADLRSAQAAAVPVDDEETTDAAAGPESVAATAGIDKPKVGMPLQRTHDAGKGGFEPQGGLRR